MAYCTIDPVKEGNIIYQAANKIALDLYKQGADGFSVKKVMSEFYTKLKKAQPNIQEDKLLTMTSLVPKAINREMIKPGSLLAPLIETHGVDVLKAAQVANDFDNLVKFMGEAISLDDKIASEAAAKRREEKENKTEDESTADLEQAFYEYPTLFPDELGGDPSVGTGLSTTNLENDATLKDPRVRASGAFIRNLITQGWAVNDAVSVSRSYILTRPNGEVIGSYTLEVIHGRKLAEEDRYEASKTIAKKLYDGAVIVFKDEAGNIVRVDEEGNPAADGKYVPQSFLRSVSVRSNGSFEFTTAGGKNLTKGLSVTPENAKRFGVTLEELRAARNAQGKFIKTITNAFEAATRKGVVSDLAIPLTPARGTLGIVSGRKVRSINEVTDFDRDLFDATLAPGSGLEMEFTQNGYDYPIKVSSPKIGDTKYAQVVKDILTSSELTAEQKKELLKDLLIKSQIGVKDGVLLLEVRRSKEEREADPKGPKTDLLEATPEAIDKFIANNYLNQPLVTGESFISIPKLEGGQWVSADVNVGDHIYNNFNVFAHFLTSGKLFTPSPVIYFRPELDAFLKYSNPTTSVTALNENVKKAVKQNVEKVAKEVKPPAESASPNTKLSDITLGFKVRKQTNIDDIFDKDDGEVLNKVPGISSKATLKQIREAKEWFDNSPLSKHITFNQLFNIINADKVGEFNGHAITLFAGSNYTDLYHEGWHGFSQLYLSKEEKIKLYNEVIKLHGDMTFREAEEFLAEDFRKYAMSGGVKVNGKATVRKSLFNKILNFLKALFSAGNTMTNYAELMSEEHSNRLLEEAYSKLYTGTFTDLKPSINNGLFNVLDKAVENVELGVEVNAKDANEISASIDSIVSQAIRERGTPKEVLGDRAKVVALYSHVERELQIQLMAAVKASELVAADQQFSAFSAEEAEAWIKKSFDIFFEDVTEDQEAALLLDIKSRVQTLLRADIALEDYQVLSQALMHFGDPALLEKNDESTMLGYHLKNSRFIESLVQIEDLNDILELDIVDDAEDYMAYYDKSGNELSVKDLADPSVLYAIRSMRVFKRNGVPVKDKYGYDKLGDFQKNYNKVGAVMAEVYSYSDMYEMLKRETLKDPAFNDLVLLIGAPSATSKRWPMQNAFWQTFNKAFVPLYIAQLDVQKEGDDTYYEAKIKRAEGEISAIEAKIRSEFIKNSLKHSELNSDGNRVINISKVIEEFDSITASNVERFVLAMGIIPEVTEGLKDFLRVPMRIKSFNFLLNNLKKWNSSVEYDINKTEPTKYLREKVRGENGVVFAGEGTLITELIGEYGKTIGMNGTNRRLNATQDTEYDTSLNSTASVLIQKLNSLQHIDDMLDSEELAMLHPSNNPEMELNSILNELFYGANDDGPRGQRRKGVTISNININGVTKSYEDEKFQEYTGKKNIQLDAYSKLNQDIMFLFMHGHLEMVRASDKSTSLGIAVDKKGKGAKSYVVSPKDALQGMNAIKVKAAPAVLKLLAGEMARIAAYKKAKQDGKLNVYTAKGKPLAGDTWQIFDSNPMLSKELKASLEKIIDSRLGEGADITAGAFYELFDTGIREQVQDGIQNYLEYHSKSIRDLLLDNRRYGGNSDILLPNNLLMSAFGTTDVSKPKASKALRDSLLIESFIRNANLFAIVNGGLASYQGADDIIKRNAITSTGNLFNYDAKAKEFLTAFGRPYTESLGYKSRAWDGTLRTAILKEVVVDQSIRKSSWYQSAKEAYKKEGFTEEQIEAALSPYTEMKEGDGQAYLTLDAYRLLSKASNEWSDVQEVIYQKIANGEQVNNPIQYFPVKKYQYNGPLVNKEIIDAKTNAQALHKYSLLPLIPSVIQGTALEKLHNSMMESQIDYVTYESGSKAARVGQPVEFLTDVNTTQRGVNSNLTEDLNSNVNRIHVAYLKDQLRINSKFKGEATLSTQFRKLISDGIYEGGKPKSQLLAKKFKGFIKAVDDLVKAETEKLRKQIKDKKSLVALVRKELDRRDVAAHNIESIQISKDGNLIIDFDALPDSAEIERILSAVVHKRLIKIKINGESLVQVSTAGFDKVGVDDNLRFYEPGKAAQVKIALQGDFAKLLYMVHPDGQKIETLDRLNALLKDEAWVKKNKSFISITGVRIPVQGLNSMEYFKVAEFLPPLAGNIIVVPSELVAKSGGDFDVDKLTMYFPSIDIKENREGKITTVKEDRLLTAVLNSFNTPNIRLGQDERNYVISLSKDGSNGFINKIIGLTGDILLAPENYTKLIRPIGTDIIQNPDKSKAYGMMEALNPNYGKSPNSLALTYTFNLAKHQANSIGKRALGISAKGNTYGTMFQNVSANLPDVFIYYKSNVYTLEEVEAMDKDTRKKINNTGVLVNKKAISLLSPTGFAGLKDQKGNHFKSDVLSQIINGHVDVGNDDFIFNIGFDELVTPYALNMLDLGVDFDTIVYFLNNPMIKEFFQRLKIQQSSITQNIVGDSTFAEYSIFKDLAIQHYPAAVALSLDANSFNKFVDAVYPGYQTKDLDAILGTEQFAKDFRNYAYQNPEAIILSNASLLSVFFSVRENNPITAESLRSQIATEKVSEKTGNISFTKKEIDPKQNADVLAEFMMMSFYFKPIKKIRLATDADTKKAKDIITAKRQSKKIEELLASGVTGDLTRDLLRGSVLQTFAEAKLTQERIFDSLFGLRTDPIFTDELHRSIEAIMKFDQPEDKVSAFTKSVTNKVIGALIRATVTKFRLTSDSYKGRPVVRVSEDSSQTEPVVFDIESKEYRVDFEMLKSQEINISDYLWNSIPQPYQHSFMAEFAYYKSYNPELSVDEVALMAIDALNIPSVLGNVAHPASLRRQFLMLLENEAAAAEMSQYSLVNDLVAYEKDGMSLYGISINNRDKDSLEQYHDELLALQASTNPEIRSFFRKLPLRLLALRPFASPRFDMMGVVSPKQISKVLNPAISLFKGLSPVQKRLAVARQVDNNNERVKALTAQEVTVEQVDLLMEEPTVEEGRVEPKSGETYEKVKYNVKTVYLSQEVTPNVQKVIAALTAAGINVVVAEGENRAKELQNALKESEVAITIANKTIKSEEGLRASGEIGIKANARGLDKAYLLIDVNRGDVEFNVIKDSINFALATNRAQRVTLNIQDATPYTEAQLNNVSSMLETFEGERVVLQKVEDSVQEIPTDEQVDEQRKNCE